MLSGWEKLGTYRCRYFFVLFVSIRLTSSLLSTTMTSSINKHSCSTSAKKFLTTNPNYGGDDSNTIIQSECSCGKVVIDISIPHDSYPKVWNCHCRHCRKYHTAAYVSYLQLQKNQIVSIRNEDMIGKYVSTCQSFHDSNKRIERWYCRECSSKLISVVPSSSGNNTTSHDRKSIDYLVNLGPINSKTIPQTNSDRWKHQLKQVEHNLNTLPEQESQSCRWAGALPSNTGMSYAEKRGVQLTDPKIWTGSCSCGACRYNIELTRLTQFQHCYCNLCRKLSGSPYSTWLPINTEHFQWKRSDSLTLVRTTPSAQRHICKKCRGALTIVYDEQPNLIWPCAGGLDDASLPENSNEIGMLLSRVCHICCRYVPPWIDLPEDGMGNLLDAC